MGKYLPAFKAYDVRGKVPSEINPELAYQIGRAYADAVEAKTVCVGHDIRLSGPAIGEALSRGLNEGGVDVIDLGMVGTEMVYFATAFYGYDGGVMITASHNPPEYNGLKMVRAESRPISGDTGLDDIEKRAFEQKWERTGQGTVTKKDVYADFVTHLLNIVKPEELKPLKVLLDPGNGAAGVALNDLLPHLPLQVTKRHFEPDGNFPNGVPNPILEESRAGTVAALKSSSHDFGVAWDGDYDRCFFFDQHGNFIEGYYIVGLLAQAILTADPNHTIVYDPRLTWNTLDIVQRLGGRAEICKSGHAFIKEKMRAVDATYGGEMSAHHYFKSHWYCDSGMIPFLLVARLVSATGRSLGDLVGEMIRNYPCSGEVNSEVADVKTVIARIEAEYGPKGEVSHIDGLSVEYPTWRFNLRGSNTEPVIRLNVESRGDEALMHEKTAELLAKIRA
ncbi:phosphomannomutase/phosphoglucomutase [Fimbriimonas ginsengisoli]|uniref:Phosphomannomutase n=1 Tax=Fimbriimonas ginsengisoli Gsoil 348 TaxID=661478 RepID=A0A068NR94_FIMGI|nr:phosphomannomutase/phosphoglucomutase [Fimbriimonas ginsengisoli]AIE85961.1 phosphomannomutase [Fimbriimonas ginsengisoli Gsoil 348]